MSLTDPAIRNTKAKEKPYTLTDGGGLTLIINPNSSKWWRLRYRFEGKPKMISLGTYPDVSLLDARIAAAEAKRALKKGKADPSAARKTEKLEKQQAQAVERTKAANAFEAVAIEWVEKQSGRWSKDHAARVLQRLEKEVFPHIGHHPINEVTAPMVLEVLRKVEARGALDVAGRVKQHVECVFRYSNAIGKTTSYNPVADLKGVLQTRKVQHRAAISEADLPGFLEALETYNGDIQTKLGLRLLILTAVRTGELRGAKWNEFDTDKGEWRIPAERMKMKAEHRVPLSSQALTTLEHLRELNGGYDLVFPGRDPKKPISENTLLYAIYRMGYHTRATGHGFRATFSTIMNERGYKPDVIERQLAHIEQNKVRAAYHRSEYLKERAQLMQDWADYLDVLATSYNVVPLRRSA